MFHIIPADFLEEHKRVLESRLQPVVREITDSRARTRDELEGDHKQTLAAFQLMLEKMISIIN